LYTFKLKFHQLIARAGSGRPVKRPPTLTEEHEKLLVNLIDEEAPLVLDEMMDSLTAQFTDLKISKTALYNFATEKRSISFKKAHFHSIESNSKEEIKSSVSHGSIYGLQNQLCIH
jgi:transposase